MSLMIVSETWKMPLLVFQVFFSFSQTIKRWCLMLLIKDIFSRPNHYLGLRYICSMIEKKSKISCSYNFVHHCTSFMNKFSYSSFTMIDNYRSEKIIEVLLYAHKVISRFEYFRIIFESWLVLMKQRAVLSTESNFDSDDRLRFSTKKS
jgi:hypothetical protein